MKVREDNNHEKYFSYGALVFAMPIEATAIKGKIYVADFSDWMYKPMSNTRYSYVDSKQAYYENGKIIVSLKNQNNNSIEKTVLIPFGKTILRQVSFK